MHTFHLKIMRHDFISISVSLDYLHKFTINSKRQNKQRIALVMSCNLVNGRHLSMIIDPFRNNGYNTAQYIEATKVDFL